LHWLRKIATRTGYHYWRDKAREPAETTLPESDVLEQIEAAQDDRMIRRGRGGPARIAGSPAADDRWF